MLACASTVILSVTAKSSPLSPYFSRVLMDVEVSLNEGALTLVNVGQPCLRIIFDLKAELKKKKTDWRLELGLGALQAFGLGGEGARATTLLTRRTWRPDEDAEGAGAMIQIGEVVLMVVVVVVATLSLLFLFLLLLLLLTLGLLLLLMLRLLLLFLVVFLLLLLLLLSSYWTLIHPKWLHAPPGLALVLVPREVRGSSVMVTVMVVM